MKSWRRPSPGILQNLESFKENLRSAAKELKVALEDVARLRRDRTAVKTAIDRLQSDPDISGGEVAGLNGELAERQERYAFQHVAGTGAN